jgi:hypothetical protein
MVRPLKTAKGYLASILHLTPPKLGQGINLPQTSICNTALDHAAREYSGPGQELQLIPIMTQSFRLVIISLHAV